jgi:serine/threonine-protein kinase
MICPRCSVAEISPLTNACELCGYVPGSNVAVEAPHADAIDELARRELAHQFQVDVLLGQGATSAVYLVRDQESNRHIILKVLPRRGDRPADADAGFREAAIAVQALDHPHLVPVLRHGTTDSLFWYTMEPVRGRPLREVLRARGPMDLKAALRLGAQVASGLDYMHRRSLTHGNVKPENVLIDPDGWAHVCDAMIPRTLEPRAPRPSTPRGPRPSGAARRPTWIAPEDFADHTRSPAADQYALGALMHECLTGQPPTPGADGLPTSLTEARPDLPAHVSAAIERAMSENPSARYAGVLDFVHALESGSQPLSQARPTGRTSQVVLSDPDWQPPPRPPLVRLARGIAFVLVPALAAWGIWAAVQWLREPQDVYQAPLVQPLVPRAPRAPGDTTAARGAAPSASRFGDSAAAAPPRSSTLRTSRVTVPLESTTRPNVPAPSRAPAPTPSAPAPAAATGEARLFVNATPWGQVFVDGQSVGNTPRANLTIAPGPHRIRVVRDGYEPFERAITVAAGETVRLTNVVLVERKP